jgi:hypothetical protein
MAMPTGTSEGPTSQLSTPNGLGGIIGWSSWSGGDDMERVGELQWPASILSYHSMMNDAQAFSLIMSLILPIRSWHWYLDENNARPEVVERISKDYNLPVGPDSQADFFRRRTQRRFSFDKHLEDALRAVYMGHYPFEQVGEILDDMKWHLRKLAPIPPKTLNEINVADDGGLKNVVQITASPNDPPIPINRLVWYAWDREGANWTGRSMLRSIYRNYIVKDRVLRVGAINIERAGGIPYVSAPEGASGDQIRELDALARRFRVGESAGAALPHGAQLKFASAAGGDGAVAFIKQQNEEMARAFLQMVNMLGTTNSGSRALGGTFQDIAQVAQFTIAKWFADTFNEHVIEDDVEWNEGPDEEFAPLLKFNAGNADPLAGFQSALGQDTGIQVDPRGDVAQTLTNGAPTKPTTARRRQAKRGSAAGGIQAAQEASPLLLPARPLRRAPYEHEVRAAIDFSAIDSAYQTALDGLMLEIQMVRSFQADEIRDAIIAATGDVTKLAQLTASASTSQGITQRLMMVAAMAAGQAVQEARQQGIHIPQQDATGLQKGIEARAAAVDTMLRTELQQSASRHAMRLTGGGLTPQEVAEDTRRHLLGRSDAYAKDVLGGAVQQSINAGRRLVYENDKEPGQLFASEILDQNTCTHCIAIDGTEYPDLLAAERDYPTGVYKNCDGRERCRGLVIKQYENAGSSTTSTPLDEVPA